MKILSILFLSLFLVFSTFAQQKLTVGMQAPEFSAASMDGSPLSLNSLRGKVVLMTFWSTRCQICNAELPKLNRLAETYSSKDVVFLGVTMENAERIEPYIKRNPFNFTIVPDGFGMVLQYADKDRQGNIDMGFPAYYLVDRNGRLAMRGSGWDKTAEIDSQIRRLLTSQK
jgi:peroxiredoxin